MHETGTGKLPVGDSALQAEKLTHFATTNVSPTEDTIRVEAADVVIVGGGGSGLAAAISAAKLGRTVILLEKAERLGGTTAWSTGVITSTNTPHQISQGIKDSPASHFEDFEKFGKHLQAADNEPLRQILTDGVPDTFRWLTDLGVEFFGPMPEAPHRRSRMHNALPNSKALVANCAREARRLGVDVRLNVRAVALLQECGRVRGVKARLPSGQSVEFRAQGAVVLASGDYSADPQFKGDFISKAAARIRPVNTYSTGDGHRMAMALGARILNSQLAHIGVRFLPPDKPHVIARLPSWRFLGRAMRWAQEHLPMALLRPVMMKFLVTVLEPSPKIFKAGAVLVGTSGELVCDSDGDRAEALGELGDQQAYLLFDARIAKAFDAWPNYISTAPGVTYAYLADYRRNRRDIFYAARTIAELAAKVGMEPAILERTVGVLNERRGAGGSEHVPLSKGPFYLMGPVRLIISFTDGGLAVDTSLRVLDMHDRPIPGLYGAGASGQGGLLLEGHGHHLAWAFTSGRLAGRAAAFECTSP
jgi:succinate dehydrogenase/fumarate reductase flavoprotein subunit